MFLKIACRAVSVIHYLGTSANYTFTLPLTVLLFIYLLFFKPIREHKTTSDSESSAKRIYVTRTKFAAL
jgi:hypothetical protein